MNYNKNKSKALKVGAGKPLLLIEAPKGLLANLLLSKLTSKEFQQGLE